MFNSSLARKFQALETPFYFYDTQLLHRTLQALSQEARRYNFTVHYALKANCNEHLLGIIQSYGLGADCVSANEVQRAIDTGFAPDHIVFAGVGKSDKEILAALRHRIFCFNCESVQELEVINELAAQTGQTASVALRINPNVAVNTHSYITTGSAENKFGIPQRDFEPLLQLLPQLSSLKVVGLHCHIGSQILDMDNFKEACQRFNHIRQWFEERGLHFDELNVGGGLGVNYQQPDDQPIPDFADYFATIDRYIARQPHQRVHFELGRAIVAQCGSLITRVLYTKEGEQKKFAITDAGMTELIRPALYQAHHHIANLSAQERPQAATELYDVVGPVCESSDFFGKNVPLPPTRRGDLLAVRTAGAYGEVMTSFYNLREKAKAYYSDQLA